MNKCQAVEVVHKVAAYNGKMSNLTLKDLQRAGKLTETMIDDGVHMDTSALAAVQRKMGMFSNNHVESLFATQKMAWLITILIIIWAFISLTFWLYNSFITYFLATRGANFGDGSTYITYCNQVILSVISIPGVPMASYFVKLSYLGTFILASTTACTSNALLGWNCGYSYTSNVMYGVLYALSPELFPTKDHGTGNVMVATANRIFGIMVGSFVVHGNLTTSVPIWILEAIFIVTGFIALLLPFEPCGHTSFAAPVKYLSLHTFQACAIVVTADIPCSPPRTGVNLRESKVAFTSQRFATSKELCTMDVKQGA
ncbi:hypothetical protein BDR06DRAFT_967428 [Suillus hirtellus]|nr:hypothetical protein BDR06DRAFT_967428 [Suillus hirtellus]